MKKLLILLVGVFLLVSVPATLYILDVKDVEKVNFITTNLMCEKLSIEKFTGKEVSPCYKELDVSHLNIQKITTKEGDIIYRID